MVRHPLFVPRRETPPLLEPVYQPLHSVAFTVDCPVEGSRSPLVGLARNGDPDATPSQICPNLPTAVPLVTYNALGSQPWTSTTNACNRSLLHQPLKGRRLVALARRQDKCDRLSVSFTAEMDFGAESPLAAAKCLGFWVPFFAPAACWWARMTVAST